MLARIKRKVAWTTNLCAASVASSLYMRACVYIADSGNLQEGQFFLVLPKLLLSKRGRGHENDVSTAVSSRSILLILPSISGLIKRLWGQVLRLQKRAPGSKPKPSVLITGGTELPQRHTVVRATQPSDLICTVLVVVLGIVWWLPSIEGEALSNNKANTICSSLPPLPGCG